MGRRSFERKNRASNQSEIRIVRDKFSGQYSDLPANELAPEACREIINACAFPDFLEPRDGFQQNLSFALPGTFTPYTVSKSTVYVTFSGYGAVTTDIGKWIVYANGAEPDLIKGVTTANVYEVYDNHAVTTTTGYVRPAVNGFLYHKFQNLYILHLGSNIYIGAPTGSLVDTQSVSWALLTQTGETIISNSQSRIREMGNWAIVFCNGIFKIDLINNTYWKTNVEPGSNTIAQPSTLKHGWFRRYVHTMSRIVLNNISPTYKPINTDRTNTADVVVGQETGANLLNGDFQDYQEIFTFDNQAGDITTTYQYLQSGASPSIGSIAGANLFFNITINGTVYTIQYSTSATATFTEVASAIQASMRAIIDPACKCIYNPGLLSFLFYLFSPGSTVDYIVSPTAVSGWTDISTLIKGTLAAGATKPSTFYYTQPAISGFTPNTNWKAFTHYSFYQTADLLLESGVITGNPSAFAWMCDYPIMHVGQGLTADGTTIALSAGKFLLQDVGAAVTIIYAYSSAYLARQAYINSVDTTANTAVISASVPVSGSTPLFIFTGVKYGIIYTAVSGVVTVASWIKAVDSVANYTPDTTSQTVLIGDPLFCSDGVVRYVTSVTSNTSFTLNDTTYSASGVCGGMMPKDNVTGYKNSTKDQNTTQTVTNRIGTLGLSSRFYRAMSAASFGVISSGFLAVAYKNKFSWNNISVNQQYIIGNNHPSFQVKEISGQINSLSVNQNFITIFCSNSTLATQTNLDLTYTDQNNGDIISILPDPIVVDNYNGVLDDLHVFNFERDMCVVINQDYGIRTWNGYQFSNNLIFKMIQLKLKALKKHLISYDEKYGVIIFGCDLTTSGSSYSLRPLNRVYTLGVREDKYLGASEFQGLPVCDINCQPVNIDSRTLYFALGDQNAWQDAVASLWLRGSNIDVISSIDKTTGRDIAWSFTTSDDISSDQSAKLRHLETHCYVSGRGTNQTIPYVVSIDCNVYNDVGSFVTITRALKTFPLYKADINFDKRIEGQRIRYQFTFTNSYLVVNGCTSCYVSYDKAASPTDRENTEYGMQVDVGILAIWLTRTPEAVEVVTGKYMQVKGTVNRVTGPDGRVLSGWST